MPRDPYNRRSVWIDILGIVLIGAVLLGGAGYLLYNAGGAARSMSGDFSQGKGSASHVQGFRSAPSFRPSGGGGAQRRATRPLLGSRSRSPHPGTAAPFSKEWRSEATPSLVGPSSSSGMSSSGTNSPNAGAWKPAHSGTAGSPPLASRSFGTGGAQPGAAGGSGWRAEARRLGGQARALSSQLGQMDRQSRAQGNTATSSSRSAGSASGANAQTADGEVPPPPSVPIDDHLHWLLVAGVLWGAWRLWRGG
jgi:hypothetical protein